MAYASDHKTLKLLEDAVMSTRESPAQGSEADDEYGCLLSPSACNGYLGVVLREPGRNTPLQAINGHCVQCGHRLAWILIRGKARYYSPAEEELLSSTICSFDLPRAVADLFV